MGFPRAHGRFRRSQSHIESVVSEIVHSQLQHRPEKASENCFVSPVAHGVVVGASGHHSFLMSCSVTKQELAQLGLLKCWKETTVRKCDVYLLPKQPDEEVATIERRGHSQQNLSHGLRQKTGFSGFPRLRDSPRVAECRGHPARKIHTVCSSNGCAGSASDKKSTASHSTGRPTTITS